MVGALPALLEGKEAELQCREYTYGELEAATEGFSEANLLRKGVSGDLYLGKLNHMPVAIKLVNVENSQVCISALFRILLPSPKDALALLAKFWAKLEERDLSYCKS